MTALHIVIAFTGNVHDLIQAVLYLEYGDRARNRTSRTIASTGSAFQWSATG